MKITIDLDDGRIADVLENAMGSGAFWYWVRDTVATFAPPQDNPPAWLEDREPSDCAPLLLGGFWRFFTDDGQLCVVDRAAIERALLLLAQPEHAHHLSNIVRGEDDAHTADVLVQLAALGAVVYG